VVIAAFDAATTGRLSLTSYNELMGSDFLQRLHDWDEWCCWQNHPYGIIKQMYIEAPELKQIVNLAFGTLQSGKFVTKDGVLREQMQRLVACRVDRAPLPLDVECALVNRASRLELYPDKENPDKEKSYLRSEVLFTACAVIRKYHYDHKKEEWKMSLERDKRDRSYQYGRLLAVLEKVERDTYGADEGREPNAIRMQSVFCQRPLYAASTIEKQLERAYFPRLRTGSRIFYKNLIGEIMGIIHE
jgi:CRISPR-associated protein Csd1